MALIREVSVATGGQTGSVRGRSAAAQPGAVPAFEEVLAALKQAAASGETDQISPSAPSLGSQFAEAFQAIERASAHIQSALAYFRGAQPTALVKNGGPSPTLPRLDVQT